MVKRLTEEQKVLAEKNIGLAKTYFRKNHKSHALSPDEVYSICLMALVYAASNYDSTKGAFSTYYYRCATFSLMREHNQRPMGGVIHVPCYVQQEKQHDIDGWGECVGLEGAVSQTAREHHPECWALIEQLRDQEHRLIAGWRYSGYTLQEIGDRLGECKESIRKKCLKIGHELMEIIDGRDYN